MVKIPENVVDQIQSQTDIVDVVGQYVQLKQSGKNLFGLCPFHEERTPSFSVSEEKQIFHCFSCGRGGNAFKFIMELENISFPEAVAKVAEFVGVSIAPQYIKNDNSNNSLNNKLIEINEQAAKLFNHILVNTKIGETALNYLQDRGMGSEVIEEFNLGYAPPNRILKSFFDEHKVDFQQLRKSGLFSEDQQGNLSDRFVDRIMFPIRDSNGKTIAFSGRLLNANPDMPKYLNSPETDIFNKRKNLFNLDKARLRIRNNQPAILFEGFMDVITAYKSGIESGIASMGTSLTEQQIYSIEKITDELIICYDGDSAGQKATKRAIEILANSKLSIKILSLPNQLDPDEFIKQNDASEFMNLLKHPQTPIDFELDYLREDYDFTSESDKSRYISESLKIISKINSPIELDLYLSKLSNEFKIDKEILKLQISSTTNPPTRIDKSTNKPNKIFEVNAKSNKKVTLVERTEQALLNRMLHYQDAWLQVTSLSDFNFLHEPYQLIFLLAQEYFTKYEIFDVSIFSNLIHEPDLQNLLIEIDMLPLFGDPTKQEIDDYINLLTKKIPVETRIVNKKTEFKDAVKQNDVNKQRQLAIELIKLEQEKRSYL
ncbi:DNA primase [Lentilactobacillus laojiaonis]|uniref:DNA primase n=1 Tax=Lentilactobacillus laojiaonis TaxID=2883998 RepID=UPI001D0BC7D3|nr:DNA primase [Lentilactobacillus laojiaonis]UDM31617.1 DNA primase [Lentilactobacillus laojiaonis]